MNKLLHVMSAVGVGLLVCAFLVGAKYVSESSFILTESDKVSHDSELFDFATTTEDHFTLAQYYFNHDGDPAPPYDLEKARAHFSAYLLKEPKGNRLAWYQLGRIDFLEGKYANAIYKFNRQIEYFGNSAPNVHYMLGLTYGYRARDTGSAEDWRRAAEGFQTYLELDPKSPWAHVDLAWVYFAQGKYEEMLPIVERGLALAPESPWLHNMYGLALLNTGERERAHEHFTRAHDGALKLTVEEWGSAYPGNDPGSWPKGLEGMRNAIAHNLELSAPEHDDEQ